ncbi:hypothetical protein [Phaeacidiphilus oryzae]|uniref:hypothetical protein n=1 Tax=Phaeacidiphilus oryzae TaxID=348818 RepID=UPI000562B568|nr:hypothetical protein [Phaeacidiphilus oryzae]
MLDQATADRLRRQLRDIPTLWVYAHMSLLPGSAPAGGRVTGATRTPPLPCRVDLLSQLGPGSALGDDTGEWPLLAVLTGWARYIAHQRQQPAPRDHVQDLTHFLLRHHRYAAQQDWAADYAAQVDHAVRPLRAVGPSDVPAGRRRTIPCPRCHRLSLVEEYRPVVRPGGVDRARIVCSRPDCACALTAVEYDALAAAAGHAVEAGVGI